MSNNITLTITTTIPQAFSGNAFTANVQITPLLFVNLPFSPVAGSTNASSSGPFVLAPGGPYVISVTVPPTAFLDPDLPTAASFSLTFDDVPSTTIPPQPFGFDINDNFFGTVSTLISCLHGSSLIKTNQGLRRIDEIKSDDLVLTGDDQLAKVILVAHCWLSHIGKDHDAIIFEPNSLNKDEPSERLIIDPGHPMCTKEEYLENGYEALRPAGSYWEELKSDKIYSKKWTDVLVQEQPSRRYDLILEEPFNTYIANGMIVASKCYKHHIYKDLI